MIQVQEWSIALLIGGLYAWSIAAMMHVGAL
jgi:hypothetical protein